MATFLQLNNKVVYECLRPNNMGFKKAYGYTRLDWTHDRILLATQLETGETLELYLSFEHMTTRMSEWLRMECIETSPADIALGKIKICEENHASVGISCQGAQKMGGPPLYHFSPLPSAPQFTAVKANSKPIAKWAPFGLTDPPFNLYFTVVNE